MAHKKYLIILAGATAIGKTQLSLQLAQKYNSPILSADSRQVYKELNIGVAKPKPHELRLVRHHLIGHISIHDTYSAGRFEKDAIQILTDYFKNNKVAICTGGTGLYIDALRYGIDSFPNIDPAIKNKWETTFKTQGIVPLQNALLKKDTPYYKVVDLNNPSRLIRALSVIDSSAQPYSTYLKNQKVQRNFTCLPLLLQRDRQDLYARIEDRVDLMIASGLQTEAHSLIPYRDLPALQTVGYKEWWPYFDGALHHNDVINKIKQKTRNYAKRQMTWFKKHGPWQVFHPNQVEEIYTYLKKVIR